jgi:hypothetical protein
MYTVNIFTDGNQESLTTLLKSIKTQGVAIDAINFIDFNPSGGALKYLGEAKSIAPATHKVASQQVPIPKILNDIITTTKSSFMVSLDARCLLYDNFFSVMMERLNKYASAGIVYSDVDQYDMKTRKTTRVFTHPFDPRIVGQANILTPGHITKIEALKGIGGYSLTAPNGEQDLIHRLSQKYLSLHIPDALLCIRS